MDYQEFVNQAEELRTRIGAVELIVICINQDGVQHTLLRGDTPTLLELLQDTLDRIYETENAPAPTLEL